MLQRRIDRRFRCRFQRAHQGRTDPAIAAACLRQRIFGAADAGLHEDRPVQRHQAVLILKRLGVITGKHCRLKLGTKARRDIGGDRNAADAAMGVKAERRAILARQLDKILAAGNALFGNPIEFAGRILDADDILMRFDQRTHGFRRHARYFAAITCGDTFAFRKPDARHILGTIEKAGGDVQRSIMVGDSINDILAARNAAVPSIGVTFGYTDVPMVELEPDVVIDDFAALTPALFEKLVSKGAAAA